MIDCTRSRWLLLTAATTLLAACNSEATNTTSGGADIFEVKRGRLRISIKENAELAAAVETRVRSEMEGQNTVISLVREGTRVQKGERLVELDASQVIEKKATQEIAVARGLAAQVGAQKGLEIQIKQNEAEMLAARNELKIAQMNQEKFYGRDGADGKREMGEQEQQRKDAEDNIKLARAEQYLAEDRLTWSQKLREKDFITKNDLETDQLSADRKKYQVDRAENQRLLLEHYDLKIKELQVEQKVREAVLALERVEAQGEAKLAQARAEVESREAEYKLAKERFENLELQVKNAVILAPTPGLVVYAFEGDGMRRREVVEEGAQVRQRQALIVLPDITRMIANLSVHEAMVDKVAIGQPVLVRIDALPDRAFTGRVSSVSSLADSSQRFSNPTAKLYKTIVALDGDNQEFLKPNMSASCEIIISEHDDVVYVPVQAVQRQRAVSYVWVKTATGHDARRIELGVHDYSYVVVRSGLEDGDRVFLAPPGGAVAPEFAQPTDPVPPPAPPVAGAPGDGETRPGEGRPRGGTGGMARFTEFRELLLQKHPEFAAIIEADRTALMTNEAIRAAIEADPELKAKSDALSSGMRGGNRGRRGEGGNAEGGRGGRSRGGETGAESGDRGNK